MAYAQQRANGDWTGYYRAPDGRKLSAGTASSKRAALDLAENEEADIRRNRWNDPSRGSITLRNYYEKHWLPNRRMEVDYKTTIESYWKTEIEPAFGDLELRQIMRSTVQGWVIDMERRGVTANTLNKKWKCLQMILAAKSGASALRDDLLPQGNPCAGTQLPAQTTREVTILTPEEAMKAIEALDPWYQVLVDFALDSGARWSELQGLVVSDVNFFNGVVTIQRRCKETTKEKSGNGTRWYTAEGTKNGDPQRVVKITSGVLADLAEHCRRLGLSTEDRLFPMHVELRRHKQKFATVKRDEVWTNGVPISRNHMSHVWLEALKQSGMPIRRIHDLRASNISWMLSDRDVDYPIVMERVGHREWATTRRYTKAMPDANDKAVGALDKIRNRASGN